MYEHLANKIERTQDKLIFLSQHMESKFDKVSEWLDNIEQFLGYNSKLQVIKAIDFIDRSY